MRALEVAVGTGFNERFDTENSMLSVDNSSDGIPQLAAV